MAKEELPRGQLSNIILSILSNTDMYGYEIIESIKDKTNGTLVIKQPSLYSCLRRMEDQNLISSYWRDSDIGGRRHYYSITDYGKKYAEKWQADLSVYNVSTATNDKENTTNITTQEPKIKESINSIEDNQKTDTILQQTNLFAINKEQTEPLKQNNEPTQKSFVQYDLFSSPTLISEPSDEVFDCIKKLRETADDENKISLEPEDKLSLLRKEISNVEIKTTYVADNYNVSNENNTQNDIKKMFLELSKKQKSFANVLKENPETVITNQSSILNEEISNTVDYSHTENNENLSDTSSIFHDEKISINNTNADLMNKKVAEMPTIYQSTTEFKDNNLTDEEDLSAPVEFIDLNFENNSNFKTEITEDEEISLELNQESDISIPEPFIAFEELKESQTTLSDKNSEQPKDDAIYITEKPNEIPKVKKIAPARFDHITKHDSRIDEKVSEIYNRRNSPQYQEEIIQDSDYNIEEQPTYDTTPTFLNDFDTLKEYYKSLNIGFNVYKKEQNTINTNYINKNKLNMASYLSISALSIVFSIIMFCLFKDFQSNYNWLYIVSPICINVINIYFITKYITNKSSISPVSSCYNYNWIYKLISSVVGIFILFAINLLFGMTLNNFNNYMTTFVYLSSIICLIPISSITNYIILKTGIANL